MSGLEYRLHALGTVLEGDLDHIFDAVKQCHVSVLQDSPRVLWTLSVDDRKDRPRPRLYKKVVSVEQRAKKVFEK